MRRDERRVAIKMFRTLADPYRSAMVEQFAKAPPSIASLATRDPRRGRDAVTLPPSLPFAGGPLYAGAFWVTFVVWETAELGLNARRRAPAVDRRDRGSFRLLVVTLGTAFALDFACVYLFPSAAIIRAARTAFVAGLGCVAAGTALRWYAVATLGHYFTVDVATRASQPVIDAGPYRLIRHPAYAGTLLALLGFALALGNGIGLLAMLLLALAAFAYRIAVEEAALLAALGEPYARYRRRTWRLIPGLV
jgi:protein-S-isoprenylcysteine O-methyltransferase Ste14